MLERVDRIDQNLLINGLVKPLCQRLPGGVATMSNVFLYQIIDRFMGRYQGNFNASPTWEVLSDDSLMKGDFIDANGSLELQQRVESLLAVSLAGEKASVSMELYSESCNQITLSLYYPLNEDDWASEQIITSETFGIPVNEDYSLKWENIDMGYNVRNGAQLRVKFHNAQTLGAVTEHKVKKIKLSVGEKAQAWSPCGRNLVEDRSLCLRYFEKSYNAQVLPGAVDPAGRIIWQGASSGGNGGRINIPFIVEKRSKPDGKLYSPDTGLIDRVGSSAGDIAGIASNANTFRMEGAMQSGASWISMQVHFTADAEL